MAEIDGVERDGRSHYENPALSEARRLASLEPRRPNDEDAPKLSVMPMTRAARVALEMNRGERKA